MLHANTIIEYGLINNKIVIAIEEEMIIEKKREEIRQMVEELRGSDPDLDLYLNTLVTKNA